MIFKHFSLISSSNIVQIITRNLHVPSGPNYINATPCLWAEPLKKRKRVDPAVVRAREERRKKKVEKEIRRLEKLKLQLKPIEEVEVPLSILDEKEKRKRPEMLSPKRLEEIAVLKKEWTRYITQKRERDSYMLDRITASQMKALEQLRLESEELYQAAVQIDAKLLPFVFIGPVDSPLIPDYPKPDGDYTDISKKWK